MLDYDMVHFPPSQIAAGAFCLALKILDNGEWTPTLQHYLSYTEESLLVVMQHLAKNVVMVNRGLSKHMVSQSVVRQGVGESRSHSDFMPACKFIAYFFKELIFN